MLWSPRIGGRRCGAGPSRSSEHAEILLAARDLTRPGARPKEWGVRRNDEWNERKRIMSLALRALNHRGTQPVPQERLEALAMWRSRKVAPQSAA